MLKQEMLLFNSTAEQNEEANRKQIEPVHSMPESLVLESASIIGLRLFYLTSFTPI